MKHYNFPIFFPAVSIATHVSCVKNDYRINGKPDLSSRFYLKDHPGNDESFIKHPFLLTSAGHNYKNMSFAKDIGVEDLSKDIELLFGDSGGFQISSGAIKDLGLETKEKIYEWLHKNSNVAPIIDCPPHATHSSNRNLDTFKKSITDTVSNIEILEKSQFHGNTSWLNVIHGTVHSHRKQWYDSVKHFDFFEGWALGSLQRNYYVILCGIALLIDEGEFEKVDTCKLIHFFGTSSLKYIPLILYIKHKLNKMGSPINISFDSSYATRDCSFGKMLIMMPNSQGLTSLHLTNKEIGNFNPDALLPSINPVCSGLKLGDVLNEDALKAASGYQFYNVIQNHNIYVLYEFVNKMWNIINTDNAHFVESGFKSEQLKLFKVIDKMFDAGKGKAHSELLKHMSILGDPEQPVSVENELDDLFE